MREQSDRYEEILKDYEQLHAQYGRTKDNKTYEEHFEAWKEWTLKHKITPAGRSQDNDEKRVAQNMFNTITRIKDKTDEGVLKILQEHQKLTLQYGRAKDNKSAEEHFEAWKAWTIEHGITPSQYSQDNEEKTIAKNMKDAIARCKKHPDKYKDVLKEYEQLYAQYGRTKDNKTYEEHFEAWKEWTLKHEITPSVNSEDKIEQKIAREAARVLVKMREQPGKYEAILKEYELLCNQYGRSKSSEEHFLAWKEWTLKHKITPAARSQDNEEKKLARNMSGALSRMKKQPDKYEVILKEYEQLYAQYGRQKLRTLQQEKNSLLTEVHSLKEQAVAAQKENNGAAKIFRESSSPHLPGDE